MDRFWSNVDIKGPDKNFFLKVGSFIIFFSLLRFIELERDEPIFVVDDIVLNFSVNFSLF